MSKMKPVFIAICVIFVVIVAGLVVYYNPIINDKDNQINALLYQASSLKAEENRLHETVNDLNTELDQKDNQTSVLNSQINSLNDQIAELNNQIGVLNSSLARQDAKEPNLTVESLTVEDVRSVAPYNLHFVAE
jgi:peptidoglycan hydrolase CwlO-like protein